MDGTACSRCQLGGPHYQGKHTCLPGEGPSPCDIVLFGEAPGATEEEKGRPFVGDAGQVLNNLLIEAGLPRPTIYITNVVKCRPPGNRTPTKDEVEACRIYVAKEIEELRPTVIIALGGCAAKALTGKEKVADSRGKLVKLLPEFRSDAQVVVTYHPAYFLYRHDSSILANIAADLKFALRVARPQQSTEKIVTGLNSPELVDTLRGLSRCEVLGCDCEWEVLEKKGSWPWSKRNGSAPRLISVALAGRVGGEPTTISMPAKGKAFEVAKAIVRKVPTIYHNAAADLPWLMAHDAVPKLAGDTLVLASLLNLQHSLSLGVLASIFTTVPPGWKVEAEDIVGRWPQDAEEWDRMLEYNARDALATLLLHEKLMALAKDRGREKALILYRKLMPAISGLVRAALSGVPFDQKLLSEMSSTTTSEIEKVKRAIAEDLGVPGFATGQPNSSVRVALAIEQQTGVALPRTLKTKKPSLTEENLLPLVNVSKPAADLMRLGKLKKLQGTYLSPWQELLQMQGDGCLHSSYKLWVARTGRSSAEAEMGGTLQQFPRSKAIRKLVRARDGYKIISADQSQIELRIAAWLANETTMLQFFRDNVDVHKATAGWLKASSKGVTLKDYLSRLDEHIANVTPTERQAGKPTNFGLLYFGQEEMLMQVAQRDYGINFTPEMAHHAKVGYFTLYPKLVPWHNSAWGWVKRGYVPSPLGRQRLLILTEGENSAGLLRKAINMPVQATASDFCIIALGAADEELEERELRQYISIIGFVHDSIILEARDDYVSTAVELVTRHLEHPDLSEFKIELPIPLVADVKVGQTWADAA